MTRRIIQSLLTVKNEEKEQVEVNKFVQLDLQLLNGPLIQNHPCAIIKNEVPLPYCFVLGINFLTKAKVHFDLV